MNATEKTVLKEAKEAFIKSPGVNLVSYGYKFSKGENTYDTSIVVGVEHKRPIESLDAGTAIPQKLGGLYTDVKEVGTIKALGYKDKMRPCPGGISIGHLDITAGTLGCWVGKDGSPVALSNNHVLANSNSAELGDEILQPGPYDGGRLGQDEIGDLLNYVKINFPDDDDDDKKKKFSNQLWKVWKWPANMLAKLVNCPFQLVVVDTRLNKLIEQPDPNLVDAAICAPHNYADVDDSIFDIGDIYGLTDFELGDDVHKSGRTTEHTYGLVTGVNTMAYVQYGEGKVALFDDQYEIVGEGGSFSAGGDSGSAVLRSDGYLGGLLFAGGAGVTIVNRITNVFQLLGLRLL